MENLTRLGQELALILIVIFPIRPFNFLRYILQRGVGWRHSPYGFMLQSIEWSKSICAPLCSMMCCWCLVLNVMVGWHLVHASLLCLMTAASIPTSSNTKHPFPSRVFTVASNIRRTSYLPCCFRLGNSCDNLTCRIALWYPWLIWSHRLLAIAIRMKDWNKKNELQVMWVATAGFIGWIRVPGTLLESAKRLVDLQLCSPLGSSV